MNYLAVISLILFPIASVKAQESCPDKRDTILPGMLEDICPIDPTKIGFKTYFLDANFKVTTKEVKKVYAFQIPEYNHAGSEFFLPKFGKAIRNNPNMKPGVKELTGEVVYRSKGAYFHVNFQKGVLISISRIGAGAEIVQSSTDLGLLLAEPPNWIRKEMFNPQGQVHHVEYWYYCGDALAQGKWKKYY
ncbi:MAG: hypothetical protein A3D92_20590 [Bacteroidetes bacterium RIFCSPHIGHO2_02_FULL_44_7]|nr:MAG: hypothetical protein A3D92_20590 [Bacteroidetes bacterium RIFCSPHIGHO2_02_FULL_44_7]